MISSVSMMFDWLGETKDDDDCRAIGDFIDQAVSQVLKGEVLTYDLGGSAGTSDVGNAVVAKLEDMLREHFAGD